MVGGAEIGQRIRECTEESTGGSRLATSWIFCSWTPNSRVPYASVSVRADESLHAITGSPMGSFVYPSEQVMGLLRAELDFTPVDRILGGGLHEYLDSLQVKMNTLDNSILNDFVTRLPAKQSQSQGQSQTAGVHAMD